MDLNEEVGRVLFGVIPIAFLSFKELARSVDAEMVAAWALLVAYLRRFRVDGCTLLALCYGVYAIAFEELMFDELLMS